MLPVDPYIAHLDPSVNLCYPYSRMSKKPDIRSFWNPVPRLSEATQKGLLTGELYGPKERDALIQSVRRGSLVEVVELYLLANASGRTDSRKRDLLKTWDAIEKRGGAVIEQSTGRRSNNAKEAREMQAQAFEQLSRSGKGQKSARNGALSKGRMPWNPTPEVRRVCEAEWFSRKYENDDERLAAIQAKVGKKDAPRRSTLHKYLGSPHGGRKPSRK